jgi:hypothetical protein
LRNVRNGVAGISLHPLQAGRHPRSCCRLRSWIELAEHGTQRFVGSCSTSLGSSQRLSPWPHDKVRWKTVPMCTPAKSFLVDHGFSVFGMPAHRYQPKRGSWMLCVCPSCTGYVFLHSIHPEFVNQKCGASSVHKSLCRAQPLSVSSSGRILLLGRPFLTAHVATQGSHRKVPDPSIPIK